MSGKRLLFLLWICLLMSGISFAQAPVSLMPEKTPPSPIKNASSIEVEPLSELEFNPDLIGTSDVHDTKYQGFGLQMWQGSSRPLIEKLLPHLPLSNSPAQRTLTKRLLLNTAYPPDIGPKSKNFLHLRLQKLVALGALQEADQLTRTLLSSISSAPQDQALAKTLINILFLSDNVETACVHTRIWGDHFLEGETDSYWNKVLIFCQLIAGENDSALLSVSLLKEQDHVDNAFYSLVNALAFPRDALPVIHQPSALHFAMLKSLKQEIPYRIEAIKNPVWLAILINDAKKTATDHDIIKSDIYHYLTPETLIEIYRAIEFEQRNIDQAIHLVESRVEKGIRANALLYQAFQNAKKPIIKAEILRTKLGLKNALSGTAGEVNNQLLSTLHPNFELSWFAPYAAKFLYKRGSPKKASKWFRIGHRTNDPESLHQSALLWPIRVISEDKSYDTEALHDWLEVIEKHPHASEQITRILVILDALGKPVSPYALERAIGNGNERYRISVPSSAILYQLQDATKAGRIAETLLLSMLILGEEGPRKMHANIVAQILIAFQENGLTEEARSLALEAITLP